MATMSPIAPSWIRCDRFLPAGVEAALQAGDDAQALLLGQLARCLHAAHADRVDGVRLLDEDVLARLDGRFGVHRDGTSMRRRSARRRPQSITFW